MKRRIIGVRGRLARVMLAGIVSVPVMAGTHVLPAKAVDCTPPVPCVANTVTYQGNVDEFMIFQGATQTIAAAVGGDSSPAGQALGTVWSTDPGPLSGDGCVVYSCSTDSSGNRNIYSYWFVSKPLKDQPGTGSVNAGWFWPVSQPSDGTEWGFTGMFISVSRNTNDICGVGVAAYVTADNGDVQAVGGSNGYKPNTTTYNGSGNSQSYGYSVGGDGVSLGGTETIAQAYADTGAYDANKQEFYTISWENDNTCHPWSVGTVGLAPWLFDGLGDGYAHWNFTYDYAYED